MQKISPKIVNPWDLAGKEGEIKTFAALVGVFAVWSQDLGVG